MAKLPGLVYNGRTKVGAEALVYFNLYPGLIVGSIAYDGTQIVKTSLAGCYGGETVDSNGFAARVLVTENAAAIDGIPLGAPIFTAEEAAEAPSTDITTFSATPSVAGDAVDIVCLGDPANDVLICYDQGFSFSPGLSSRPIPRKFNPADHYVRQRPENSLSLTDLFVSNWDGLQAIKGKTVSIIVKISPDGSGSYSEIQYYGGVRLNPVPINAPGDANESMEISMDGTFNFVAIFSATKP